MSTCSTTAAPSTAGPMGFFAKKSGDAPATAQTNGAASEAVSPISYNALLTQSDQEGRDVSLDTESRNILEEAARQARESIFRTEDDSKDK